MVTDDKGDVLAAAEFLMTNDCRVGSVSTVVADLQCTKTLLGGIVTTRES